MTAAEWLAGYRQRHPHSADTWELTAYGYGPSWGGHYARRRSDDGVERHADGQPCACPNAAAYAPLTPARLAGWLALAWLAFDRANPHIVSTPGWNGAGYMMRGGMLTPTQLAYYLGLI